MKTVKFLAAMTAFLSFSAFAQAQTKDTFHEEQLPVLCGFEPKKVQELAAKDSFTSRTAILATSLGGAPAEIFVNPKGGIAIFLYASEKDMCLVGVGEFVETKK